MNRGTTNQIALDDEACCALLLGDWTQQYHGKRSLTIRRDGTATLRVEPNNIGKLLFGPRVEFRIDWKVDTGRAIFSIVGGEPAEKVQLAIKMWGQHWDQPILDLSPQRLLLLDTDGETQYDWHRPNGE